MGWVKAFAVAAAIGMSGAVAPLTAQELKIGVMAQPSAMDPHFHNLTPNNSMLSHIFERLVETAADGKLKPGLATSWKTIDDTTWEFKLRPDVKWHNGSAFTADDVVFTFERAPNVPNSPSSFASAIKGKTIKKVDDLTVHISTAAPFPLMPNALSNVLIVSKAVGNGAKTEDYNSGKAAVGTGPYKFASYVPDDRVEVVRNDAYWGGKPQWEKITFRPIKAAPARVAALLSGDVDMIEDVPTTDIERLKKDDKLTIVQTVSRRVIYFHLDQARDVTPFIKGKDGAEIKNPLKDLRVRQALSKAINREAIVSRVMEGAAIPASQFLSEQFFGTSKQLKPVAYDPEGAKKLLEAAGYPNGFKMTMHGPNGRYTNDVKIIEAVAQMFTRIGVETTVETLPPAVFFSRASTGNKGEPEFSFILVGWSADTGETSGSLKPLVGTFDKEKGSGTANRGRYSNPDLDKLVEEALKTNDDAKRGEILAKASETAINDVAIIPVQYPLSTWALKKGLKYPGRADEYTIGSDVTR
ncbi:MAG TPA: ABC transporter substrate-binding protein [Hyphomicrobiaceae bacterium]|nr:ABC transporter substrate-binding protein [Hyphomicrobiaceae bacterium]